MTEIPARKLSDQPARLASLVVSLFSLLFFGASERSWAQSGSKDTNHTTAATKKLYITDNKLIWQRICKESKISDAVSSLIVRANECLKNNDVAQARRLFDAAVKAAPQNSFVRSQRRTMFCNQGDFKAVIADCDVVLRKSPDNSDALHDRGFAFFLNKQYQEGIDDMTRLTKLEPGSAWAYTQRAIAYRKLGKVEEGKKDDLKAHELEAPRNPVKNTVNSTVHDATEHANALVAAGQFVEAQKVLDQALSSDPKDKDLHRARAKLFISTRRYDDARKECAFYITATDWDAFIDRGHAYEGADKLIEAINDYSTAIRLMRPNLAQAKKLMQRVELSKPEALADLKSQHKRLLFLPNTYFMTLESRAKAYVKTNHAELAIIDCNDCLLMLQHSVPEVNAIRADAFEMSGRAKQALADYQVVIKQKADVDESLKAETSPEKRGYLSALSRSLRPTLIHALKQGALVADKLSDAPTAITYYSQLILMNAGENEYYLRRAKVYEKSKQYDKAQADLDKYIAHEPKDAVAYDLRARIKAEQGRYALAIDDYTTAIKAAPEDAEFLLDKRAALYEKMGRKDQASQDRLEIQKIRTKH